MNKERIRGLVAFICSAAAFIAIVCILNYIYVVNGEPWYDQWYRNLYHSYYEQDNIDCLVLGTSHVHFGIDPNMLDEINGMNNFNMAKPGQRYDDSYYLLREVDSSHDLKEVLLECSYQCLYEELVPNEDRTGYKYVDYIHDPANFASPWMITYHMRPSVNRFKMLVTAADKDYALATIFPFVRYRENLFDMETIRYNIGLKRSPEYRNYDYDYTVPDSHGIMTHISYPGKGYYYYDGAILEDEEKIVKLNADITADPLGEESLGYMRRIIEYCQAKGIKISLFSLPVYDVETVSCGDYDRFIAAMREFASEYGLEVYDFTLIKDEALPLPKDEMFWDHAHMNRAGCEFYTPLVWQTLHDPGSTASLFADSYAQILAQREPEIDGLWFRDVSYDDRPDPAGIFGGGWREYNVASSRPDMTYVIRKGPYEASGEETGGDSGQPGGVSGQTGDGFGQTGDDLFEEVEQISPGRFMLPAGEYGLIEVTGTCGDDIVSMRVKY